MPGGGGDRILTYGDSVLVRSDLSILRGPHFLNDRLIYFYLSHLAATCCDDRILLVPPSISFLISHYPDPTSLADVIAPLVLPERDLVLLPVNDNPDVTVAEGGSHWSLLVCHVATGEFVHHDSSRGFNRAHALRLFNSVKGFVCRDGARYVEGPTPQQMNGYDCGIYVLCIAKSVCEWYCKKDKRGGEREGNWFDVLRKEVSSEKVGLMREEILNLILGLIEKNNK